MQGFVEITFATIDSTNTWAHDHIDQLDPTKITCVIAEKQTRGRGRELRKWVSPKGNLYCTFCFQLPKNTSHIPSLGLILSYSCSLTIQKHKLHPQIKWPNDVLVNGKKIAGILCETIFEKDHIQTFLGIGVNINMEEKLLAAIDQPATSLSHELQKTFSITDFYQELRKQFAEDLQQFTENSFAPFQTPIQSLLAYKGQEVQLTDGKQNYRGVCHSISQSGELHLELKSGEMKTLHSGEISFIR